MLLHHSYLTVLGILYTLASHAQDLQAYSAQTMDSTYKYYRVDEVPLFREQYPFDANYRADYLGSNENQPNPYSYLWPFSGVLSAQVARYESDRSDAIKQEIRDGVLKGLDYYYDKRNPSAYASYINTAKPSDRFYDDNIWVGIDFVDLYLLTSNEEYLDKAKEIWAFIESGTDSKLGGGIYWCEQRQESKNTCSNAPGSVLALKLYQATEDDQYFALGKALYHWTKEQLQDPNDGLYFDNINLKGRVDSTKYSYNSGQMIQAAALLYRITNDKSYLEDAQKTADASYQYFFTEYPDTDFPRLRDGNTWFHAIMLRGFVELYHLDNNPQYMDTFKKNMVFAWENMRSENGLFTANWSLKNDRRRKWLLNQFAMAEMFARLSTI